MTLQSAPPRPADRSDLAACVTLCAVVLVASFAALRGDLIGYMDNPVHLAEIRQLARPDNHGWSDYAFCGFPLGLLQSPLTFGGLAWALRLGIPLQPIYTAATIVGLAAPAFAFFYVARARVPTPWALGLASTLVVYRGSLVGGGAALGGMFGAHIASAALLLVLDIFASERRTLRHAAVVATLAGLIGLTHMYVTIGLVYLTVVHVAWSCALRGPRIRRLYWDLPALALGTATSAAYWMPNLLARTVATGLTEQFSRVVSRLVTANAPLPPPGAGLVARVLFDPIFNVDAILQLVVLLAAVLGIRAALRGEDDAPRYGLTIAALFLFLEGTQQYTNLFLLGPQSDRMIYIVKLGLLVASLSAVGTFAAKTPTGRAGLPVAIAFALVFGALAGKVVAEEAVPPSDPDYARLDPIWARLRSLRDEHWARTWVQDTFGIRLGGKLDWSHVLGTTAERTGIEQIGAYYGSTPFNYLWLYEPSLNSGYDAADVQVVDRTLSLMRRINANRLLLVDPRQFSLFQGDPRLETRFLEGRFLLLGVRDAPPAWATVASGTGTAALDRIAPGRLRVTLGGDVRRVFISESYHPFWRVAGSAEAHLGKDADGLMQLDVTTTQGGVVDLDYAPPRFPLVISLMGAGLTLVLFALSGQAARVRLRIPEHGPT